MKQELLMNAPNLIFLDSNQVAELFRCKPETVLKLRSDGILQGAKVGKEYVFHQDDVLEAYRRRREMDSLSSDGESKQSELDPGQPAVSAPSPGGGQVTKGKTSGRRRGSRPSLEGMLVPVARPKS